MPAKISPPSEATYPAFQDQRHALLENFLNGYTLDHASKVLFPLRDTHRLAGVAFSGPSAAKHLCALFRTSVRVPTRPADVRMQSFENWALRPKPDVLADLMRELRAEFKAVESHLVGAYVHGSLSDLQLTPYSDADLLVVLKTAAVRDPAALLAVRRALFRVNRRIRAWDPLQHHGVFVLAEPDLDAYCPAWLPLAAIGKATALVGPDRLAFRVRDGRTEAKAALADHVRYLGRLLEKTGDAYHFKEMCSIVMLLPALVLGARGTFLYKPDSFAPARRLFQKKSWNAVAMASKIRRTWRKKPGFASLASRFPTFWASTLASRLEPVRRDVRFEDAVRLLLKDPVLKT